MAKQESDNLPKISIWRLKKMGALDGFDEPKEMIRIYGSGLEDLVVITLHVNALGQEDYMQLCHARTNSDGEKEVFKYQVSLYKTACNYGGYRYWFLCPSCLKRVGVLYKGGNYFACRHCFDLTYKSSKLNRRERRIGRTLTLQQINYLQDSVKLPYRKGKMTRKYARFLKENGKFVRSMVSEMVYFTEWAMKKFASLGKNG